jgi:hypothetical protein
LTGRGASTTVLMLVLTPSALLLQLGPCEVSGARHLPVIDICAREIPFGFAASRRTPKARLSARCEKLLRNLCRPLKRTLFVSGLAFPALPCAGLSRPAATRLVRGTLIGHAFHSDLCRSCRAFTSRRFSAGARHSHPPRFSFRFVPLVPGFHVPPLRGWCAICPTPRCKPPSFVTNLERQGHAGRRAH